MYWIKRTLYTLKKQYGSPITLFHIQSTLNVETGKQEIQRQIVNVKKAIILPEILARKYSYDRAFIAAGKGFTYGATFEVGEQTFIVEKKDIPKDWEIFLEDYIVYQNRRFTISKSTILEHQLAYMIIAKELKGQKPFSVLNLKAESRFPITSETRGSI